MLRAASTKSLPCFSLPGLAEAVEKLTPDEVDLLTFGVIGLDRNQVVRVFNKTEAIKSGYQDRPSQGRLFFRDVAPCMNNGYFKGLIDKAIAAGTFDLSFTFVGDFSQSDRELEVRAQPASDGGVWIFINRPDLEEAAI